LKRRSSAKVLKGEGARSRQPHFPMSWPAADSSFMSLFGVPYYYLPRGEVGKERIDCQRAVFQGGKKRDISRAEKILWLNVS
jgi:hypothetical protein